jgi:hypothetical protein
MTEKLYKGILLDFKAKTAEYIWLQIKKEYICKVLDTDNIITPASLGNGDKLYAAGTKSLIISTELKTTVEKVRNIFFKK